jgi:lysozyme
VVAELARQLPALQDEFNFDTIAVTGKSGAAVGFALSMVSGINVVHVRKGESTHGDMIEGPTGHSAIALGATFEGEKLVAYKDPVGIPTICRGHTAGVKMGDTATPAECESLAYIDTMDALRDVDRLVTVPINGNELGAYTDFVYNVGATKFASSTMLRKLNAGDHNGACAELLRWVYAGGKVLRGLVLRREAEYKLCMKPEQA